MHLVLLREKLHRLRRRRAVQPHNELLGRRDAHPRLPPFALTLSFCTVRDKLAAEAVCPECGGRRRSVVRVRRQRDRQFHRVVLRSKYMPSRARRRWASRWCIISSRGIVENNAVELRGHFVVRLHVPSPNHVRHGGLGRLHARVGRRHEKRIGRHILERVRVSHPQSMGEQRSQVAVDRSVEVNQPLALHVWRRRLIRPQRLIEALAHAQRVKVPALSAQLHGAVRLAFGGFPALRMCPRPRQGKRGQREPEQQCWE